MIIYSILKKQLRFIVPIFLYQRLSLLKHKLRNVFFKPFIIDYLNHQINLKFYINDYNSKDWYSNGIIAETEINSLKNIKFKNVLYCGSHQAVVPIILTKIFKLEKMTCYEALLSNVKISNDNLKLNNIDNIFIYHAAISDKNANLRIENNTHNSFISKDTNNSLEVRSYALKDIIKKEHYDLIIIDIEGYEIKALSNCDFDNIDKCFIELHGDEMLRKYNNQNKDIYDFFENKKFQFFLYNEINKSLISIENRLDIPKKRCWLLITKIINNVGKF